MGAREFIVAGAAVAFAAFAECRAEETVVVYPANAIIVSHGGDAAEELALHLKLIAGVDVPVIRDAKEADGRFAFRFDSARVGGSPEACEWIAQPDGVTFRGNEYFAVVDFLENALGVRWPGGEFVSYERQNPIRLSATRGAWDPAMRIRNIRYSGDRWSRRMRRGGHNRPAYGHAFTGHWAKYGLEHRDYFAMREDGVRGPVDMSAQALASMNEATRLAADTDKSLAICCTSTGLVAQVVADWEAAGRKPYINLCENDVEIICHCPSCLALDVTPEKVDKSWQTHFADRYVWFGNKVLETARRKRPDVQVCYYAYNRTTDAPERERPAEGTVIGLVPTYFSDKYIANYVNSWKNAGATKFFYRPNRHHYYNYPYLCVGAEEHFFGVVKYLAEQGTIGFDYDAREVNKGPGFEWFERYVLYHAMQDPSKPFTYWEDHYFQAYGAAAGDAKAYYRFWRDNVWKKRLEPKMDEIARRGGCFNFARGLVQHFGEYVSLDDYREAERFVAAAEGRQLQPPQSELVAQLRIAHDHSRLLAAAILSNSREATEALADYRRAHGYPLYVWSEQYYGDITGMEKFVGPNPNKKRKKGRKW